MPKDQKTQTYTRSISDFPSTTDALVWYLEGERKAAGEAKRQVRSDNQFGIPHQNLIIL